MLGQTVHVPNGVYLARFPVVIAPVCRLPTGGMLPEKKVAGTPVGLSGRLDPVRFVKPSSSVTFL